MPHCQLASVHARTFCMQELDDSVQDLIVWILHHHGLLADQLHCLTLRRGTGLCPPLVSPPVPVIYLIAMPVVGACLTPPPLHTCNHCATTMRCCKTVVCFYALCACGGACASLGQAVMALLSQVAANVLLGSAWMACTPIQVQNLFPLPARCGVPQTAANRTCAMM